MKNRKIFVGQSSLRFKVECNTDITSCLVKKIKYMKPGDETVYEWNAVISDSVNGHIIYDVVLTTELDVAGKWKFWSYIQFSDGRIAMGDAETIEIFEVGTL